MKGMTMMKRWMPLVLMLALLTSSALAEEGGQRLVNGNLAQWATFEGAAPADVQPALAASPFAGAEVLRGAVVRIDTGSGMGLMAARLGGQTLLLGLTHRAGEAWQVQIAAEDFLRKEADFGIEAFPFVTAETYLSGEEEAGIYSIALAVTYGEEQFLINGSGEQGWRLFQYRRAGEIVIAANSTDELLRVYQPGGVETALSGCGTALLETLSADTFPTTLAEAQTYAQAHPWPAVENLAYVSGVNLRQQASDRSASLGMYLRGAPVVIQRVQVDGWCAVRVGDTEGWMYGVYVNRCGEPFSNASVDAPLPVGRTTEAVALAATPGGPEKRQLPPGTALHVLTEAKDGYLPVCVPRGELTYLADEAGEFGYVPAASVQTAPTPLMLKVLP